MDEEEKMLGVSELKKLLVDNAGLSALEIKEKILARAIAFSAGAGQRRRPDLRGHEGALKMDELEKKLGYRFRDRELLRTALTHKSFNEGGRNHGLDNERLEFLGDSVIGLVITDYHLPPLPRHPRGRPGQAARPPGVEQPAVQGGQVHRPGRPPPAGPRRGEEPGAAQQQDRLLVLRGAGGGPVPRLRLRHRDARSSSSSSARSWSGLINDEMRINDYKSELQELIQKHRNILPVYKVTGESGKPPDTVFRVAVFLEDSEIGSGSGRNRREAEQEAALIALKNIGNFIHFEKLSETFFGEKPKSS